MTAPRDTKRPRCHRCGKRHLYSHVYLELNAHTGQWSDPAITDVPTNESQGLFPFGEMCARRVLGLGGSH